MQWLVKQIDPKKKQKVNPSTQFQLPWTSCLRDFRILLRPCIKTICTWVFLPNLHDTLGLFFSRLYQGMCESTNKTVDTLHTLKIYKEKKVIYKDFHHDHLFHPVLSSVLSKSSLMFSAPTKKPLFIKYRLRRLLEKDNKWSCSGK